MNSRAVRGSQSSLILAADLFFIAGTFSAVFYYRIGKFPDFSSLDLWLITATFIAVLFLSGTYFRERSTKLPRPPVRTFWLCILAGVLCIGWLYILGPSKFNQYFGRGVLPFATIICGVAITLVRYFVNRIYHLQEQEFEILYLGYSDHAASFLQETRNHLEVRMITVASARPEVLLTDQVSWSAKPISELISTRQWQTVVVDPDFNANSEEAECLVELRLAGTPVLALADFYEHYWYMIPVTGIDHNWFLRSQGFTVLDNPIARRVKRVVDIVFSCLLIVVSAPIVLVCGLLIKLTSKGPILYRQKRVGLEGKKFTILKLRTMREDAEQGGPQWAEKGDSRITSVGRFLRDSRLDEIPQCWNVLAGDMSFVGPRPERPEFTKELTEQIPFYDLRHLVKPGITGWAQVIFPYGASVEDSKKKLQYELFYIKNQSLLLDMNIMLRTIITVFQRAGR